MTAVTGPECLLCGAADAELLATLDRPPAGEKDYGVPPERYRRSIHRCRSCGVYLNVHDFLSGDYYAGSYNESIYAGRLLEAFRRIRALPPGQSDNKQRVRRIAEFLARGGRPAAEVRVLDVGSGLCVFLAELKGHGSECHCVDPDPAAVKHALVHAGVDGAWAGTLETFRTDLRFDLVTFNKVLEHVTDPARLLRQARELLKPGGSIYVELPDGDLARRVGGVVERQEFFAEHYAVYGPGSLARLAREAGCACPEPVSLREPSGKCTVYAFLSPA